jgi:pimeloyl-ACP methyl ester carboxylesterase
VHGKISGLILISGADPDAPSAGVPTLVIHGVDDNMAPLSEALGYAQKNGARFVGLPAGHFAMLVRKEQSDRAVRSFVAGFSSSRATAARR